MFRCFFAVLQKEKENPSVFAMQTLHTAPYLAPAPVKIHKAKDAALRGEECKAQVRVWEGRVAEDQYWTQQHDDDGCSIGGSCRAAINKAMKMK